MSSAPILAWVPGFWEWILIGVVAVLLFGRRLPEVGRSLGKGVVEFKKGLRDVEDDLATAGQDTGNKSAPPGSPPAEPNTQEPPKPDNSS
jgi:sec-independent protein translocase protein TatA